MNKYLTLFRGDDIINDRTKPAIYRSEGIVSGAFGAGGAPKEIERKGFLKSVKEHIDHLKDFEIQYYKISDYISFSEEEEIAKLWASRKRPENLISTTEPYAETRYVFKMDIPMEELKPIVPGVYEYRFACNKNLKTAYKLNEYDVYEPILQTYALQFADCPQCGSVHKSHSIIVINPLVAFNHLKDDKNIKRSIRLAQKNLEWLILPNDIIQDGFRASRIQPANFWKAEGYTMLGEAVRNPFTVPYKHY